MPTKEGLHARSATDRLAAVKAIVNRPDVDPEVLISVLTDKSNLVVAAAATILGERQYGAAVQPMVDCYERLASNGVKYDPGCTARIAIVQALVRCGAYTASQVYFDAIKTVQSERIGDTGVALRVQAAVALATLRPPGALLALAILLFDIEPQVPYAPDDRLYVTLNARLMAAQALAALGDAGAVAVLGVKLTYSQDELAEVLLECMDALAQLDSQAALDLLPPYLQRQNAYLVVGAATALAGLPHPEVEQVVPLLLAALPQVPVDAQVPMALTLASIRSDAAVEALSALADHINESIRLAAVEGLKQRGDHLAQDALQEVAQRSGDKKVVQAAKQALDELL